MNVKLRSYAAALVLVLSVSAMQTGVGATLYVSERTEGGVRYAIITDLIVTPQEFHSTNFGSSSTGYSAIDMGYGQKWATCWTGGGAGHPQCGAPLNPPCSTGYEAAAAARGFIGKTIDLTPLLGLPMRTWGTKCTTNGRVLFSFASSNIVSVPVPVSCTSNTTEIRMQGQVGAKLKDSADVSIHCDSEASLKLTIPSGGLVKVGGVGEVQLKFQASGKDVLNVTGTDPRVRIDGELTKSPTIAGTYKGSTVLLLDVL